MAACRSILFALVVLFILAGCAVKPNPRNMTPQQRLIYELSLAQGIDQFRRVERIDFTFNVESGDRANRRSWSWRPKSNLVTFDGQFTYQRDQLFGRVDPNILEADKKFINDSFWLLMPLHLQWASDVTVRETGQAMPPLGHEPLRRIVVTYSATGGGYTPGDVYELFVDQENVVREWIFHRGGAAEPTLICTWEGYQEVGPLRLALDHVNREAEFRLWFTNVTVRTTDGQTHTVAGP